MDIPGEVWIAGGTIATIVGTWISAARAAAKSRDTVVERLNQQDVRSAEQHGENRTSIRGIEVNMKGIEQTLVRHDERLTACERRPSQVVCPQRHNDPPG
jgi:hypothetical protein